MNARRRFFVLARSLLAMALVTGLLHASVQPAHAATQTDIHGPAGSGQFGRQVTVLPNGNFVVTDPSYNGGIGVDAGAAYLYNGATGAMISKLTGSNANNQVGSGGVVVLSNGNYVVRSHRWDNGGTADVGAVTWGSKTGGVSGAVSPSNSLVGSTADDQAGNWGVTALSNGDYVVSSPGWDNGGATNAGAVTWGNGAGGTVGPVTAANSLVGSTAGDQVGASITPLTNGNYVVQTTFWDNGGAADAGAVTWGNGAGGTAGAVSPANSLVGSTADDYVGYGGVVELSNGNYVVRSSEWDNGGVSNAGAVTWANGASGIAGEISAANSLVGSTADDWVGSEGVTALSNGDYVVRSSLWNNGAVPCAGAVTWGNGAAGTTGVVSADNSLVGSTAYDRIGFHGVAALSNGHYVVGSPYWNDGGTADAGAATWGNGNGGTTGPVSAGNSLVGSTAGDQVGFIGTVTALSNGNYVVGSPWWDDGGVMDAGAATWGNGATGITGPVTTINSLVGSTAGDQVGFRLTALSDGDYVVGSPLWDNGGTADVGAATWGNGVAGIAGPVSTGNSLVGSTAGDQVGYSSTALSNGDYVVISFYWDNLGAANAGAVTWSDGSGGTVGPVSSANSLVGSTADDRVGYYLAALSDGDYVVRSPDWDAAGVSNAGAVTWGSGDGGVKGPVSALNSLVGETANDQVGSDVLTPLDDGSYAVRSLFWDNGGTADAGAVSWGFGPTGMPGPITAANSVRGAAAGGGWALTFAYDPVNHQLVVGRPADNIVTLFKLVYGVSLTPPTAAKTGAPGAAVSYTLRVTNNGDTTESFNLAAGSHAWTTNLPATFGPLAAGASQDVIVNVTVPRAAPGGSTDSVTITVASQADESKTDTAVLTTTAGMRKIYMPVVRKR